MIMSLTNCLREHRDRRGWSQAELASRAGLSRPEISAVETGRLVPSTAAALALAAALDARVEEIFTLGGVEEWAWSSSSRFWRASVGSRTWRYPVERTLAGEIPSGGDPHRTVVIAGCDPAVGILAAELATRGWRLIPIVRSSARALELLAEGKVHFAGVHLGGAAGVARRVRLADWEVGIALARGAGCTSVRQALRANLRWINRDEGSGARRCLDRLLGGRRPRGYRHEAADHTGVAEVVRSGWAQAGFCVRLVAEEAGLDFLSVQREPYDLCTTLADDPRVEATIDAVRSMRRSLAELPGYDTRHTGEVR